MDKIWDVPSPGQLQLAMVAKIFSATVAVFTKTKILNVLLTCRYISQMCLQ